MSKPYTRNGLAFRTLCDGTLIATLSKDTISPYAEVRKPNDGHGWRAMCVASRPAEEIPVYAETFKGLCTEVKEQLQKFLK